MHFLHEYLQILSDPGTVKVNFTLWPAGTHMPVLFPNVAVFLSVSRYYGRHDKGASSTNSSHSLKPKIFMSKGGKEMGGNALLLSPAHVLWNLLGCEEGSAWIYSTPPWTFMSAFADSVNRSSTGLDRFSVYCMKSIFLHLRSVDDNLSFHHVLVLAHKFLARLQVCEACRDISRHFCGAVSESLAVWSLLLTFHQLLKEFCFHVWKDCAKTELWISVFI